MAMSAFRSTTRRNCQIGGGSSSTEGGGVPSTPRSKREPSPSGRSFHRRSASVTDFSTRYLSDCSSTSEFRSSYNKGSRTGRGSVCPSDSESDMDSLSAHRWRSGRRGVESEDERPINSSASKTGFIQAERKGLRRTMSSQDFSQAISKMRQHVPVVDKKTGDDEKEDLVEEKTIRAVYAQMKSLHNDPPVGDVGMTDFLDAMRAEVRRAVSDIRMELEESMQKNGKLSMTGNAENRSEPQGADVIQAVADIRKEYTTKLEESERRVRELWSQIAVEERRCLELSKIVKELLPTQPPMVVQTPAAHTSSNRRRPLRRKNSAERQLDLRSLDEEAQRYFEECVSISSYDCQGDSDESMQEKENSTRRKNGKDLNAKAVMGTNLKGEPQSKAFSVGSDGVVLPWLQWEAEGGAGGDKNMKQVVERNGKGGKSSPSHRLGGSNTQSGNSKMSASRNLITRTSAEHGKPALTLTMAATIGVPESKSNVSESKQEAHTSSSSLFSLDDDAVQNETIFLDVDTSLFEKIRFRCRIENGELLLCHGLFLM